ncbi:hypothetical protein [Streptomyces sp. WAC00263]|uniref:hypothetical protein n=1 Tax=Streptomyces sp. WAC00263 TaxID=1917422 RepID=UPI0015EF9709|nr:hypothetical protein [Streptomyces sp. WAC00263]
MGSFARALEDFFTLHHLALPTDQAERLAAGRRQRRIEAVPEPLRQAVVAFNASRMRAQDRARRAGTRPRSNHTLETALATLRDLAVFLVVGVQVNVRHLVRRNVLRFRGGGGWGP